MGQPCLGAGDPKKGLGVPEEVETLRESWGSPVHRPPGLTPSRPPGMLCLAESACWHARSGDRRLPSRFLLRRVYFVSP